MCSQGSRSAPKKSVKRTLMDLRIRTLHPQQSATQGALQEAGDTGLDQTDTGLLSGSFWLEGNTDSLHYGGSSWTEET